MRGFSELCGSWKTNWTRLRRRANAPPAPGPVSVSPNRRTVPEVAGIRPTSIRPVVDLPEPDSPTRPSVSPRAMSKSTRRTACRRRAGWPTRRFSAKVLVRSRTATIGSASGAASASGPQGLQGPAAAVARGSSLRPCERDRDGPDGSGDPRRATARTRLVEAQQRRRPLAAGRQGLGTARAESTAGDVERRVGDAAGDRLQPAGRSFEATEWRPAARRCTDASASRTALSPGAVSITWPAYITATRSANWAITPRSWVIRITDMPSSRLQVASGAAGSATGS